MTMMMLNNYNEHGFHHGLHQTGQDQQLLDYYYRRHHIQLQHNSKLRSQVLFVLLLKKQTHIDSM